LTNNLKQFAHPMHNPEVVKRRSETFKKNWTPERRRRYSEAAKKKWKDPKFRAKQDKARDTTKFMEIQDQGNPASRTLASRRKRSRSKENTSATSNNNYRKYGNEKVTKIDNRGTEKRINDYSGVITAEEMESLQ